MEEVENEPTFTERAQAVLGQLSMTTHEGIMNDHPLPDWIVQPWAAAIFDPYDPDFESSVIKAEAWLASR